MPQLAELLGTKMGIQPDDTIVEYALDKLSTANLLEESQVTRRDAVRRLTLAGVQDPRTSGF